MACMPRRLRLASAGFVYHVLNRAVGRSRLFTKEGDYAAFEQVLRQAHDFVPMRLLAYCALPNHWHLLLWSERDGALSDYMRWLTVTHTQRWHAQHHTSGTGPLYQGRFKSFPVQTDGHFYTVCRYVERNALRAQLVGSAEQWRWSSLWHRWQQSAGLLLADWPVPVPATWLEYVNGVESEGELEAVRHCLRRGAPYGESSWQEQTAKRLGLETSLRARGRPRTRLPTDA